MSRKMAGRVDGRKTRARARGWRTLMLASPRAARPSEVRRRASAICASRSGSMSRPSAVGQSARCTDWSSPAPVRARHMASAMKGQSGASRSDSVVRTSCNVAWAARVSPAGASGSVRQKRRRLRRTYQLERSSTRAASGGRGVERLVGRQRRR